MPRTACLLVAFLAACGGTPPMLTVDAAAPLIDATTSADASIDADTDAAVAVDAAPAATIPTNDHPSPRTAALYALLARQVTAPGAFFGQQFASWQGNAGNLDGFDSDIYRALAAAIGDAAEHPAVFGWSFETWARGGPALRARLVQRIVDTDAAGGINTVHWPMGNPAMDCGDRDCGDNDNEPELDPVHLIATDPEIAARFDARLDDLAGFLASLHDRGGAAIPIILRPFHEMNTANPTLHSHWWAGRKPAEYRMMFQRVVDQLRARGVDNVLIAFAPRGELLGDGPETLAELYARYWPETDPRTAAGRYVDIAGFDAYLSDDEPAEPLTAAVDTAYAFATAPDRIVPRLSAVTELGRKDGTGAPCTSGPVCYQGGRFWTERVLPGMNAEGGIRWTRTAYLMTWTNGTFSTYLGAPDDQAADFIAWFRDPATRFLGEVPSF